MVSNIVKGDALESLISSKIHQRYCPLLVSPTLLRRYGAGQIDVALIDQKKGVFTLYECKAQLSFISSKQQLRLMNSLELISSILNINGQLEYITT